MNKMQLYFEQSCVLTAFLSTCQSKHVGAILVKDNRIIASGYNGVTSKQVHCEDMQFNSREEHHLWSTNNELHAEQNIIAFCARNNIQTQDTILYLTLSPCIHCAKLIVAAGIKEVQFKELYDLDTSGIDFLKNHLISTKQWKHEE